MDDVLAPAVSSEPIWPADKLEDKADESEEEEEMLLRPVFGVSCVCGEFEDDDAAGGVVGVGLSAEWRLYNDRKNVYYLVNELRRPWRVTAKYRTLAWILGAGRN